MFLGGQGCGLRRWHLRVGRACAVEPCRASRVSAGRCKHGALGVSCVKELARRHPSVISPLSYGARGETPDRFVYFSVTFCSLGCGIAPLPLCVSENGGLFAWVSDMTLGSICSNNFGYYPAASAWRGELLHTQFHDRTQGHLEDLARGVLHQKSRPFFVARASHESGVSGVGCLRPIHRRNSQ